MMMINITITTIIVVMMVMLMKIQEGSLKVMMFMIPMTSLIMTRIIHLLSDYFSTPLKFNRKSPWKNDGWKMILSFWNDFPIFRGYCC